MYISSTKIYFTLQKYISCTKIYFTLQKYISSTKIYFTVQKYISSTKIYFAVQKYISSTKIYFQYKNIFYNTKIYFRSGSYRKHVLHTSGAKWRNTMARHRDYQTNKPQIFALTVCFLWKKVTIFAQNVVRA